MQDEDHEVVLVPPNSLVYDENFRTKFINPIAVSADDQNKAVAESNKTPNRVAKADNTEDIQVEDDLSKKNELDVSQISSAPVAADDKQEAPMKQDLLSAEAELLALKKQLEAEKAKAVVERAKVLAERAQIDAERRLNEEERKKQEKLREKELAEMAKLNVEKAEQERLAQLARIERIELEKEKEALEKKKKKRATSFSF